MKKTDKELVEMIAKSLHNKGEHGKALDVVEIYNVIRIFSSNVNK